MRRVLVALVITLALGALVGAPASGAPASTTPVQDRYAAPGPSAVVHVPLVDSFGDVPFELYRPADLGPAGTRHPLVTWGNGSFAHPAEYDPFLRHLASWGFVVIASTYDQVGTGDQQLAAVRKVRRMSEDPGDPLFGHVDLDHVAAAGHSQGGGGSVRAALAPDSPITTLLTFDLPTELFRFDPKTKGFDTAAIRVPVLFLSGSDDQLISGTTSNHEYFHSVPGPAGVALLTGADHNGIQHGTRPYPGYATAWLRYQLLGDPEAAAAFTGAHPELLTAPGWQDQALKGLQPPLTYSPSVVRPTDVTTTTVGAGRTFASPRVSTTVPSTAVEAEPTSRQQLPTTGGMVPLSVAGLAVLASLALRRAAGPAAAGRRR